MACTAGSRPVQAELEMDVEAWRMETFAADLDFKVGESLAASSA
jgi:hypothetical protein